MTADDISNLISQVALGNRDAFRNLYQATSPKLFGVCLRILKDRADSEDALQEIYVKVWRDAASFVATEYSPISWLVAVARNHAIDRIRARKPASSELESVADVLVSEDNPELNAQRASERRQIDGCLEELDTARAQAVREAYLEGYSYEELATRLGIPINTVRTWLRRSLLKLKECLER